MLDYMPTKTYVQVMPKYNSTEAHRSKMSINTLPTEVPNFPNKHSLSSRLRYIAYMWRARHARIA
jgi:hypothetical protein